MSIELADDIFRLAQQQAVSAGFNDVTEYIASLIRTDRLRTRKEQLDLELLLRLDGGEPALMTPDDWLRLRQELQEHWAQQATSSSMISDPRVSPVALAGSLADDPWITEICDEAYRLRDQEPRE